MKETINEIIIEILELDAVNEEQMDREKNAGWDSIKHLEIIMAIEEEFDIRFTASEVTQVKNVTDLYTMIEAKVNA
ncbi:MULTISPECIES: acyl carrier protein [Lysinibacillus]|uniref:acyl carrier protein n=1 Tax=Lysinibacillus TaxID=400634 RepID=UPI00257C96B8|nr:MULTISPECIES: acyl carrier protein [Lysinibacillus]